MTQPDKSITFEGELTHDWWRDEYDQVNVDGQPIDELLVDLPIVDKKEQMFAMSPTSAPYVVERHISYGRVRVTIEALQ